MQLMKVRLYSGGPWVEIPAIIGPQGPKGDSGWFRIADVYSTLAALRSAFPTGNENMYLVEADSECYVWSATANDWVSVGTIQGPSSIIESDTPPQDTTKFWRDTTDGKIKYYDAEAGEWLPVGSGKEMTDDEALDYAYETGLVEPYAQSGYVLFTDAAGKIFVS